MADPSENIKIPFPDLFNPTDFQTNEPKEKEDNISTKIDVMEKNISVIIMKLLFLFLLMWC